MIKLGALLNIQSTKICIIMIICQWEIWEIYILEEERLCNWHGKERFSEDERLRSTLINKKLEQNNGKQNLVHMHVYIYNLI